MDWPSLTRIGYSLRVGKQSWSVWFFRSADRKELVASGRKRPATPLVTIRDRALRAATVDFVRRRVSDDLGQFTLKQSAREQAKRQLSAWWANRIDELMAEQLIGKR